MRATERKGTEAARLVISAVRARDELTVVAEGREPSLKVVLLGGSVVELARDDGHNVVGELELEEKYIRNR